MRRILAATAFAILASVPGSGRADPCAGAAPFSDVNAADSFCTNVVWLANRGITTGCGGGAFCPFSDVTRAQMALFMNRFAVTLAPTVVTEVGSALAAVSSDPSVMCGTADIPTGAYPRTVSGISTLNADMPSAGIDISARIVYSADAGATWIPFSNSPRWYTYSALYANQSPPSDVTTTQITPNITVPAGINIRFGVEVQRFAGSGTANLYCALRVTLANSNATTVLFDPRVEPADAVPEAKGKR